MIPLEIPKLKICVREDAMDGNESFKRQVGIPSRPLALPAGIFDSTFSASIFVRRTSNLSKSSIGEFGGPYQFEIRNGLALGF